MKPADPVNAVLAIAVVFLSCLAVAAIATRRLDRSVRLVTVASFLIHVAISLTLYSLVGLWAEDAATYNRDASLLLLDWEADGFTLAGPSGREGFIALVAVTYAVAGGATPIPMLILNALAVALAGAVTASTVKIWGGEVRAQRLAAIIVLVFPGFAIWSSFMLREALVVLLVALAGNAAVRAVNSRPWVWQGLLSLAALFYIRGTAAILVAVALLPALALTGKRRPAPLVMALVVAAALAGPIAARASGLLDVTDDLDRRRQALSGASTGFSSDGVLDPVGTLRVAVGPLPWEWSGSLLIPMADALCCWVLLYLAWKGLRSIGLTQGLAVVLPAAALILALAAVGSNYGLVIRLRAQAYILAVPLAAIGVEVIRAKRAARLALRRTRPRMRRRARAMSSAGRL